MLSKGNMGLFPTTLIESNTMKKLITLILSAVLSCPMWAGAQTNTIPSINGQLHYVGSIPVLTVFSNIPVLDSSCGTITNLRLNIQSPNNASPIKFTSGYFNCSNGYWAPFSGTLVATINYGYPNTTNTPSTGYTGVFALGLAQMHCDFSADLTSVYCLMYAFGGSLAYPAMMGSGFFTYTSAP
jgi:hypothetical protein